MITKALASVAAAAGLSVLLNAAQQTPARGGGFRQPDAIDFSEHDGWTSLFDGKTLNGWSGDAYWKV